MHRAELFIVTAFLEVGAGLLLLFVPSVFLVLLLGVEQAAPESLFVARVAGAALLSLGVACGVGWKSNRNPARLGLSIGILIYDVTVAGLLTYAGLLSNRIGVALWPAVALHGSLSVWCAQSLRDELRGENIERKRSMIHDSP